MGCKLIFRCHIQIQTELLREKNSAQSVVWNYLWHFIKHCDLFVFHPIVECIPEQVDKRQVWMMGASTDPLDGLNKPLSIEQMQFYQCWFNRICEEQGVPKINFSSPYFIQIARFDPSKGIEDVIKAFDLYQKISQDTQTQLIICGIGSVDDPDGSLVLHQTKMLLSQ